MSAESRPSAVLPGLIAEVVSGRDLSAGETRDAFRQVMAGEAPPALVAALLTALQTKGPVAAEVAGGVEALAEAMTPVPAPRPEDLLDTCGTGGGTVSTFNVSTAAALVAAGGGVRVAKHGNRSFTSRCGSADVMEALGVRIDLTPARMAGALAEAGVTFMFAPLLHAAMRHVAAVRRELRIHTIMNLLGPLANPAGAQRQVVGVADPAHLDLVAGALAELGRRRALVVHGAPGMDEVSPCGPTQVAELRGGRVSSYWVEPEEMGMAAAAQADSLAGGTPERNASMIRAVLSGRERGGPRSAVVVNAAAAFVAAGRAGSLREGTVRAAQAIDSGAAAATLEALVRAASVDRGSADEAPES